MNAAISLGAAGPGALSIAAEIADGRVCSVRVVSTRPTNLSRLFIGRPADEAPLLAERMFSLCGVSHRAVARRAIAAARNESSCARRVQAETIALLADRASGTLRSSMILALNGSGAAPSVGLIRPLSEILSLTRELCALTLASSSVTNSSRVAAKSLIRKISTLARDHAFFAERSDSVGAPGESPFFDPLRREISNCGGLVAVVPDVLSGADDAAVLDGVRSEGEAFSALPSLQGRAPETGAFARHWRETDFSHNVLAARFEARMIDLAETFDRLERAGEGEESGASAVSPSAREGFAAAETSRGRLYHWVRLTREDRIKDYAIVAPTEWNFHPAGPFVSALLGAAVHPKSAERWIAQLAALFDPCVPFRIETKEPIFA
jgi:hypothetical protein